MDGKVFAETETVCHGDDDRSGVEHVVLCFQDARGVLGSIVWVLQRPLFRLRLRQVSSSFLSTSSTRAKRPSGINGSHPLPSHRRRVAQGFAVTSFRQRDASRDQEGSTFDDAVRPRLDRQGRVRGESGRPSRRRWRRRGRRQRRIRCAQSLLRPAPDRLDDRARPCGDRVRDAPDFGVRRVRRREVHLDGRARVARFPGQVRRGVEQGIALGGGCPRADGVRGGDGRGREAVEAGGGADGDERGSCAEGAARAESATPRQVRRVPPLLATCFLFD